MTNYVLVHGAWHGGWCWRSVKRGLQDSGCDVYTPTLTGLGERAHLASHEISLVTHIRDVLAVLEDRRRPGRSQLRRNCLHGGGADAVIQ